MLTIEPYRAPESASDGQPAYTLPHTGVQLLCHLVDVLSLRELEARAWTTSPHTEPTESIWGHLWVDRLLMHYGTAFDAAEDFKRNHHT